MNVRVNVLVALEAFTHLRHVSITAFGVGGNNATIAGLLAGLLFLIDHGSIFRPIGVFFLIAFDEIPGATEIDRVLQTTQLNGPFEQAAFATMIVNSESNEVWFSKADHVRIDYCGASHVAGRFGVKRWNPAIGPNFLPVEVGFIDIVDGIYTEEEAAPAPRFRNLDGAAVPGKAVVITNLGFPIAWDLDGLPRLRVEGDRGDEEDAEKVVHDDRVSETVNLRPGMGSTIVGGGRGEIRSVD